MKRFFTSDYHFFHTMILKYCLRPFKSVEEMNSAIIKRHNERVSKYDRVYFLGDFGFFASKNRAFRGEGQPYDPHEILNQMNGKFKMVCGNHDKSSNKLKIKTEQIIIKHGGLRIQLIHDPAYAKIEYDLILCGHVHKKWKIKELDYLNRKRLIINVGVDQWNFYPASWNDISKLYNNWKQVRKRDNSEEIYNFFQKENK